MDSYCYARRKCNYNQPIYGCHVNDINYYLDDMGEHILQQYFDIKYTILSFCTV